MSYLGYERLEDLDGLRPSIQLMTLIGVVATQFASLEEYVVQTTLAFLTPPGTGDLHRDDRSRRATYLRRKSMSQKIEMLELVWPSIWTSFQPLKDRLRRASEHRNSLAHAFDMIDVMTMLEDGIDLDGGDEAFAPYWQIQDGRANRRVVDLHAIDAVVREFRELNEAIAAVHFLFSFSTNTPLDIAWVMRNRAGSHSRVDKPEQDPDFVGWS